MANTVSGGRYLAGGVLVDASGKPLVWTITPSVPIVPVEVTRPSEPQAEAPEPALEPAPVLEQPKPVTPKPKRGKKTT